MGANVSRTRMGRKFRNQLKSPAPWLDLHKQHGELNIEIGLLPGDVETWFEAVNAFRDDTPYDGQNEFAVAAQSKMGKNYFLNAFHFMCGGICASDCDNIDKAEFVFDIHDFAKTGVLTEDQVVMAISNTCLGLAAFANAGSATRDCVGATLVKVKGKLPDGATKSVFVAFLGKMLGGKSEDDWTIPGLLDQFGWENAHANVGNEEEEKKKEDKTKARIKEWREANKSNDEVEATDWALKVDADPECSAYLSLPEEERKKEQDKVVLAIAKKMGDLIRQNSTNFISIFREIDDSGDSRLDPVELRGGLRDALNVALTKAQTVMLFDRWDNDKSGEIELKEMRGDLKESIRRTKKKTKFVALARADETPESDLEDEIIEEMGYESDGEYDDETGMLILALAAQLKDLIKKYTTNFQSIFREMDKDRNNTLDQGELKRGFAAALGVELTDEQVFMLFERFDHDAGGTLELREVRDQLRKAVRRTNPAHPGGVKPMAELEIKTEVRMKWKQEGYIKSKTDHSDVHDTDVYAKYSGDEEDAPAAAEAKE